MSLSGNSEQVVIGVYVVESVFNDSYDSGVLRTKLIGECFQNVVLQNLIPVCLIPVVATVQLCVLTRTFTVLCCVHICDRVSLVHLYR